MDKTLIAQHTVEINATPSQIWDVLTHPEKIKVYLYGTQVSTDWKEGSQISFKGQYQGNIYEDKGKVISVSPQEELKYNYWSGMSGLEDTPENYSNVSYIIKAIDSSRCEFTWHQQGFSSEKSKCHTEEGLKSMLAQIKTLSEK